MKVDLFCARPADHSRRALLFAAAGTALATPARAFARLERRPAPAARLYPLIAGAFVVAGKQPDGDSVRFRPDDPGRLDALVRAQRIRVSADGSVQLRLEGVDAPELHYGRHEQPRGPEARDALLRALGFAAVAYGPDGMSARSAEPPIVRGAILARAAEVNGRPVAYLLRAGALPRTLPRELPVDDELLARTINFDLLAAGEVYFTVYTSTPSAHAERLRAAAAGARARGRGLWTSDRSRGFPLRAAEDLGPGGALVLPKLFRRAVDYLRDVGAGRFEGDLPSWISEQERRGRGGNDRVRVRGRGEARLAELVRHEGDQAALLADPLDLTFVGA